MALDKDLIDKLLGDYQKPEDLIGENGLLKQLTKALVERAMNAELTHHLGYEKNDAEGRGSGNSRNGVSRKTLTGDFGEVEIEVPRDRVGDFEPKIVGKHQRRFTGFDDKILSMYARGMSTREIQGHLKEIYGAEVSPTLISEVTDAVIDELQQWQSRPLEPIYAIIYLDALYVKMRHEGRVENRAVYVAVGIGMDGLKDVLGLWTVDKEGAKAWLTFMTEFRNRGVKDVLVVCVDGLKGFPEAIETVFPKALVQLCIVHLIRNSLNYVNWKERKLVAADLKAVYTAPTAEAAEQELSRFGEKWDKRYGAIRSMWQRHWDRVIPFFAFTPEIRKVMYTTNAIESLNMSLRKIIKTRGSFPSEQAALKLLYMALKNVVTNWQRNGVHHWKEALNQFMVLWGDRIREATREIGVRIKEGPRQKSGHAWGRSGGGSSLVGNPGAKYFRVGVRIFTRKKKNQKERTCGRGSLWKLPQPWEIDKGGLRRLFLDDFHRCLKKACAKTAPAFFTVPTGPTTIKLTIGD